MPEPDLQNLSAQMRKQGFAFHHNGGENPSMFQVIGERASGTNVVRKAIEQNLQISRTDGLGWKHGFPGMTSIPQNMVVICLFRNAVAWSLSMHKRPWHAHPDLLHLPYSEFIRAEWQSVVDRVSDFGQIHRHIRPHAKNTILQHDRHPITGAPFTNLFELRMAKMVAALGVRNRGCHFAWIRLEAFQVDPELVLTRFCTAFDITPKDTVFHGVKRRMGTRYKSQVRNRPETPKTISQQDLEFLRSQVDPRVEAILGYGY